MSKTPKARSCYICGRQYMLHSFAIHETQCRAMFEKWENQKPAKDRRKCPDDPMRGYNPNMSMKELDKLNAESQQVWSEQALVRCQNCNRTFLPEKLPIHQRSCTASNPARRVEAPIKETREDSGSMSGSIRNGSGKYNTFDENETVNMNSGNLMQCQNCGRSFNAIPYSKHIKICAKVFTKPRKVFNSAKQRMQGTELEQFAKQSMRGGKTSSGIGASKRPAGSAPVPSATNPNRGGGGGGEMPKWKQDSLRFRNAMKAAREVSRAEKKSKETGIPLHLLLPAGPSGSSRGGAGGGARAGRQDWDDGGYGGGNGGGGSGAYQESGALQCPTCGRTFSQKAGERHIPQCKNIIAKPSRLNRNSGAPSYSTMSAESTGRQLGTFGSVGARMTPSSGSMGGGGGAGGGGGGGMGGMSSGMSSGGGGFGGGGGGGAGPMQRPPIGPGGRSSLANTTGTATSSAQPSVRQSSSLPGSRPGSAGLRGAGAAAVGSSYMSQPSPRSGGGMPTSSRGGGFGSGGRGVATGPPSSAGGGGAGGYRIASSNATSSGNPLMGGRW